MVVTTWYSNKELDSILVTMETQLSLRYVAVWNEATRKHAVCGYTAIDSHSTIRFLTG